MANRITCVVVDCADHEKLAAFWCAVLGYEVVDRSADASDSWVEIGPPGQPPKGPVPTLLFQTVPDPTPGKNRVHLDVNATDRDQDAELQRLLELGATRADVGQTGEESWHVLADPEGNEFCLLHDRIDPLPSA
jgi:catechol 2,3-dioxygenase-like lactoylglutathione lyase family enzyme